MPTFRAGTSISWLFVLLHLFSFQISSLIPLDCPPLVGRDCVLLIDFDGEADGHPERRGATAAAGRAVGVDTASEGGVARTHRQEPPVGPAQKYSE